MNLKRLLLAAALAGGAFLATTLTLGSTPASAAAPKCLDGWSKGSWDLPLGKASGHANGKLVPTGWTTGLYELDAKLIATPSPCLSCIQGKVIGTLDDGFGPGPDFTIEGEYSGAWLTGKGTWWAYIYLPGASTPSGKIAGDFADPFLGIGEYKAEWKICW